MKSKKIFRIRECHGFKGGQNHYYHADVISTHWQTALKAANEGRVTNWRRIDTFDTAMETYRWYEYLYMVTPKEASIPAEPKDKTPDYYKVLPKPSWWELFKNTRSVK